MLHSLHIENIALIKRLDIDFGERFNVLTGETGAGKSILIDSIGILLGDKFDRSLLRTGETEAMVSGVLSGLSDELLSTLSESGISAEEDGSLLISRQINADGRSRARINGVSVPVGMLRIVGEDAIAILGQGEHQLLKDEASYLSYLRQYANAETEEETYCALYEQYVSLNTERKQLSMSEGERLRTVEMYTYQLKDIDALALRAGEEQELREQEQLIKGAEKIEKNARFVYTALKGGEKGNALMLLEKCIASIERLADVIPSATGMSEQLKDCFYKMDDVAMQTYDLLAFHNDENPTAALDRIEGRLADIQRVKKKYGETVEEVLLYAESLRRKLDAIRQADQRIEEIDNEIAKKQEILEKAAERLHAKRKNAADDLASKVVENLKYLDMAHVRFVIHVKRYQNEKGTYIYRADGADQVEFLISTNKGEDLRPLSRVASGGERSRILLALRSIIAGKDQVGTLIFDEIDTGVSGKTARKLGVKLLKLGQSEQILCVTHSAQVASLADTHLFIRKSEIGQRTETTVSELDYIGRLEEIARILGGIDVTDAQRSAALDMLKEKDVLLDA